MLILDTHVWLWWIEQNARLPCWLAAQVADPATLIALSAVSIYELSLGVGRGRIVLNRPLTDWIQQATVEAEIQVLPVTAKIAGLAGQLPRHHLDPLDRLIIATALTHQAQLASLDDKFPLYAELNKTLVKRDDHDPQTLA
ncbi:MAG: type II toxin-antitoxin system VapC family toxin [Candidatus Competibacteraceae bacterium]|nr:type II toxin-antitoxin system VapC family toxin [Candidatus Competibacteraceae bacterium]MBK8754772.1 type II toxin-antitoxin system VapC family toxin [Candidatus Competibacteraceae bacterium]